MSIVAALDKVLFFNASSKYSVLRMKTEDSSVPAEARSPYRYHDHLIRFTAVGIELPQTDTVKIEMDGEWKDGKYGLQLQVDHWQEIVPPTLEGVRNYLASGLLKASEKRPPTRSLKSLVSTLWRFWNISQTGFLRSAVLQRSGLRRSRTPMRKPAGCVS